MEIRIHKFFSILMRVPPIFVIDTLLKVGLGTSNEPLVYNSTDDGFQLVDNQNDFFETVATAGNSVFSNQVLSGSQITNDLNYGPLNFILDLKSIGCFLCCIAAFCIFLLWTRHLLIVYVYLASLACLFLSYTCNSFTMNAVISYMEADNTGIGLFALLPNLQLSDLWNGPGWLIFANYFFQIALAVVFYGLYNGPKHPMLQYFIIFCFSVPSYFVVYPVPASFMLKAPPVAAFFPLVINIFWLCYNAFEIWRTIYRGYDLLPIHLLVVVHSLTRVATAASRPCSFASLNISKRSSSSSSSSQCQFIQLIIALHLPPRDDDDDGLTPSPAPLYIITVSKLETNKVSHPIIDHSRSIRNSPASVENYNDVASQHSLPPATRVAGADGSDQLAAREDSRPAASPSSARLHGPHEDSDPGRGPSPLSRLVHRPEQAAARDLAGPEAGRGPARTRTPAHRALDALPRGPAQVQGAGSRRAPVLREVLPVPAVEALRQLAARAAHAQVLLAGLSGAARSAPAAQGAPGQGAESAAAGRTGADQPGPRPSRFAQPQASSHRRYRCYPQLEILTVRVSADRSERNHHRSPTIIIAAAERNNCDHTKQNKEKSKSARAKTRLYLDIQNTNRPVCPPANRRSTSPRSKDVFEQLQVRVQLPEQQQRDQGRALRAAPAPAPGEGRAASALGGDGARDRATEPQGARRLRRGGEAPTGAHRAGALHRGASREAGAAPEEARRLRRGGETGPAAAAPGDRLREGREARLLRSALRGSHDEKSCLALLQENSSERIVSALFLGNHPHVPAVAASAWPIWIDRLYGEEDNDDVVGILDNENATLRRFYGDFYLSEEVRHPEACRRVLVAERSNNVLVAVLAVNCLVDLDLLDRHFELSAFAGFRKFREQDSRFVRTAAASDRAERLRHRIVRRGGQARRAQVSGTVGRELRVLPRARLLPTAAAHRSSSLPVPRQFRGK
ncbi:unnamed protein product [Trichogramma brassicae]|uniref:Uncharacterized protein n=1 Tax=Trichogramma brassicae TaxID=86971 RepID=A0A6H5IUB1_9HYME|nr:unnamed protein product [Trichogramma brassicae]